MRVAIVYDSRTGTTKTAAYAMGKRFEEQGHAVTVQSVVDADPAQVAQADLICVGCWTQGLYLLLQRPTRAAMLFIARLGDLQGREAVVFCTYKLATGGLLGRMADALTAKGAAVVARFKFRGPSPSPRFEAFVAGGA